MNFCEIAAAWKADIIDEAANLSRWNNKAEHFGGLKLPTVQDNLTMRLIAENNMVNPGDRILDVGCGGGRFSFALEQLGARALGVDFSPNMIAACRKNGEALGSKATFQVCNWHTVDLESAGWAKAFDLVLANMTPAIASAETFLKLSQASRGWCLMVKPTRRTNSVLDVLHQLLDLPQESQTLDKAIVYGFDLLWLKGWHPYLDYEPQVWENQLPVEQAVQEYTSRIRSSHPLTPVQEECIRQYLEEHSVDGMVQETSHTLIAAMYWQVK